MRKLFLNALYLLPMCLLLSVGNSSASVKWPFDESYSGISDFISEYCHCGQIEIGKRVIDGRLVPACRMAHSHRGLLNAFDRKYVMAVEDYSKALEFSIQYNGADKRHEFWCRVFANAALGRFIEALNDCDSNLAVSKNQDERAYNLALRGWICLLAGQPEKAVSDLGESIDLSTRQAASSFTKQSASSLALRAIAYEQLGKKHLAEQDFEKALLELSSEKPYPLMSRAQVYLLARRPRQAIDACSILISNAEDQMAQVYLDHYYAIRGDAYMTMGDFRNAAKDYASAVDFKPEFALLHSKLAYAYEKMCKTTLSKHHAQEAARLGYRRISEPPTFALLMLEL